MRKRFFLFVDICLIVSGVAGAGFATGQEILLYFGGKNPFVVCIACLLFFFVFFKVGFNLFDNLNNSETKFLFKKVKVNLSKIYEIFCCIACFVILSAMIGGTKTNASLSWGFTNSFSIISELVVLFCATVACFAMRGLKIVGLIFTPIMCVVMIYVCFYNGQYSFGGKTIGVLTNSLLYVSLNTTALFGVLNDLGKKYNSRQKNEFSFFAAIILSVMIFFIISSINANDYTLMPLVNIASKNKTLGAVYGGIVLVSIITTLCTSAYPLIKYLNRYLKSKCLASVVIFSLGYIVSLLGFKVIVEVFYPMISILGIAMVGIFLYFKKRNKSLLPMNQSFFQKSDQKVHKGGD